MLLTWDARYDFRDKKIGVIGGGSSAIQIVPSLQKLRGTKMTCFVRSKTWISNPFGDGRSWSSLLSSTLADTNL